MKNIRADGSVLVIAGSDFQIPETSLMFHGGKNDYTGQIAFMRNVLQKIKDEYGTAYGFLAGGDYNFDEIKHIPAATRRGINTMKSSVTAMFETRDIDFVVVHGNHDALVEECSPSGANDTEKYGVFVLRENEYRSYPANKFKWQDPENSEKIVRELSEELRAYLEEKASSGYDKPVFIASHVPLHYSTRTKAESDAVFARYFYDVIHEYGDRLNIIYLFGHNHAWSDDDYLGGGSVFLASGESINIALPGDKDNYTPAELNFTYMNYGYAGYYWAKWVTRPEEIIMGNADNTLTLTSFLISGSRVEISRWDENGRHPLKSPGAPSPGQRAKAPFEVCPIDTSTRSCVYTVEK